MRFLRPRLPQPPDDLEGGVGLARAGRHDQQNAVPALGDGLDRRVDRVDLIVARLLAAAVVVVILKNDLLGFGVEALPGAIARPQVSGRREGVETKVQLAAANWRRCGHGTRSRRRSKRRRTGFQRLGIVERLLHAVADAVGVVLRLDQGDRDVRLVVENEVGLLRLAARHQLAAHDDAALGETRPPPEPAPSRPSLPRLTAGSDELGADVAFGEASLVHTGQPPPCSSLFEAASPVRFFSCTSNLFRRSYSSIASTTTTGRPCFATATGSARARSISRPNPYFASFALRVCIRLPAYACITFGQFGPMKQ